ncbi:hypothetical protein SAY86_000067 [Trapa natans]|uniref:Uncharacterized protein n=1 Tax=Trapa natans TaxID=22666 RepID=A0AAN7MA82_TRANT|nr:hypothetical protein SAY86_000067 [Trapa natans]
MQERGGRSEKWRKPKNTNVKECDDVTVSEREFAERSDDVTGTCRSWGRWAGGHAHDVPKWEWGRQWRWNRGREGREEWTNRFGIINVPGFYYLLAILQVGLFGICKKRYNSTNLHKSYSPFLLYGH